MKRIIIFCILTFTLMVSVVNAQNVRGRLDGYGPYGLYPAQRVAVTLFSPTFGRTTPAYSDYQGMYYIYNVPPGQHVLEVWANEAQPLTFNIFVNPNQLVTDITPIRVR